LASAAVGPSSRDTFTTSRSSASPGFSFWNSGLGTNALIGWFGIASRLSSASTAPSLVRKISRDVNGGTSVYKPGSWVIRSGTPRHTTSAAMRCP
jgi:hypothetical protein